MHRTCAFYTLGCKVNQYDTEALMNLFQERGYEVVDFDEPADVYCINTCTVTGMSDHKSRQAIRRARAMNPDAVVAVVGCYSQAAPDEVSAIPGVNVVMGTHGRGKLVELVESIRSPDEKILMVEDIDKVTGFEEIPVRHFYGRTRASVKIQEGCDSYCSYCRVPYARGRVRSRLPENVVEEVKRLVEMGYKEIVLTGIHLGAYGRDLGCDARGRRIDLAWILKHILPVRGKARIRLSSVEPREVTDELIDLIAAGCGIARHLHIPLESGDDYILRLMNRPYTRDYYLDLARRIKARIPDVAITTDIMVGFPQETEERFNSTLDLAREVGFSRLHVFRYSKRPGTRASTLPGQVSPKVKRKRSERMISLGKELALEFHRRFIGRRLAVLFEEFSREEGKAWGLSDNYIRTSVGGCADLVGQIREVVVRRAGPDSVTAEL